MGILPFKLSTDESMTGSSDLAWMTKGEVILAYYQDLGVGESEKVLRVPLRKI